MTSLASPRKFLLWFLPLFVAASLACAQPGSPFTSGAWSGNVTATSATVSIRLTAPGVGVRLALSTSDTLATAKFFGSLVTSTASGNTAVIDATGLDPNTDYFYGFEVAGVLRAETVSRGRFRTFPSGAASFKIFFGGDNDYRTLDQRAFDEILAARPLLFIHLGDLHYNDTNTTNPNDYRANFDRVLNQPNESALFRGVPLAYMWDDHDCTGNDCDGSFIGVPTARAVYRERVPHYPIGPTDGSIGQSFTVGRVRVIMTDTRSAATPSIQPESAGKSRLGAAQKAWFKQELLNARDAGFPLILWVETDPWIDPPKIGADTWAGWATERVELADFLRANRIPNVVLLSADMHALAYDDGTHSGYATGGGSPLVVLQAAALTEGASIKGGPYTAGPLPGAGQYGILEISDSGGPAIACRFLGMKVKEGVKLVLQMNASIDGIDTSFVPVTDDGTGRSLINVSARGRITRAGETLIAGFVIGGRTPRSILVRAVGPSLAAFGLTDALPKPVVTLFSGPTVIASNANWSLNDAARLTAAFDRAGAFHLVSPTSQDAALVITLLPGAYTLQASALDGTVGTVLAEAYEIP